MQYLTLGSADSGGVTVGIEDSTGSDGIQYSYNTPGTIFDNLAIRYYVPQYLVSVLPDPSLMYGDILTTLSHNLTVINEGANNDTYDLFISGNIWTTEIYDATGTFLISSLNVPTGSSDDVVVKVSIPGGVNYGDYDLAQFTATSQNDTGVSYSSSLNTTYFAVPTNVALIKDADPWSLTSIQDVLTSNSIPFDVYTSSDIGVVDLSPYDKVIIPSDQPQAFYNAFEANLAWFESYVNSGGILQFSAGSNGWNGGTLTNLPGGYSRGSSSSNSVTIDLPGHHFTNFPNPITDSELDGWSSSCHGYFTGIPPNSVVVSTSSNGPCLVESVSGMGRYFAYTLIAEWGWGQGYSNILENIILSMYGWAAFPDFAMNLTPNSQNWYGNVGADVDYVLNVSNLGTQNDTYDLAYSGVWPVTFRDIGDTMDITTVSVDSGLTQEIIARVSIPGGAFPGDLDLSGITCTSQTDTNISESAQLSTQVPFLAGWVDGFESGLTGWRTEILTTSTPFPTAWEAGDPAGSGPSAAFNGTNCAGTNVWSEYYPDADVTLISPYVELGAAPMILSFYNWYTMDTNGDDGGFVEVSVSGGPWTQITPVAGYPWIGGYLGGYWLDGYSGTESVWTPDRFDLNAYSGQVIQVRFHMAASGWEGWQWGWYLDDVYMGAPPPYEMILTPEDQRYYANAGGTWDYIHTIENTGTSDDTYDLSVTGNLWPVTFRDISDTSDITSWSVAAGLTEDFIVRVDVPGGAAPGEMDITVINCSSQNDSSVWDLSTVTTQVPYTTLWSDGFEAGWGGWIQEEYSESNPWPTSWEFGDPLGTGPSSAASGVNCAGTNVADDYYQGVDMGLISPYILLGSAPLEFTFSTWYEMNTGGDDGGFVEISVDGGPWNQIWPVAGYPVVGGNMGGYFTDGYSGVTSGWEQDLYDLSAYAGSVVRLRFHFATTDWWGWQWGWYLDDIYIGPPPPYRLELSPDYNTSFGSVGTDVDYVLSITNTGTQNDIYDLSYSGIWPIVFRDAVDTMDITSLSVNSGSQGTFIARVSIPGGANPGEFDLADINASSQGDPLQWIIAQVDTGVSLSPPWLEDFEAGIFGGSTGMNWTRTDPSYIDVGTQTAQSGLYSMYTSADVVSVTSIPIDLSALPSAEFRCWVQRGSDTFSEDPDTGENLIIEYLDNNDNWIQLDSYTGSGTAGEVYTPLHTLPADALHSKFQLRFRQTGGSGFDMDYWHIDDVYVGAPLGDVTPPGDIIDLFVSTTTSSTVTISWTAPGDDGSSGTAAGYEVRYSTLGIINSGNWGSATVFSQSWTPLPGGSTETHDVTGLTSSTQYWFAIRTRDEVPNWSGISNSPSGTTLAPSDITLPADITDLTIWNISTNFVTLRWTATGDDGTSGTATSYEVRYSTAGPIDNGNWASATIFAQSWTPLSSGTFEYYDITGLTPGVQYWFAIRAADEEPNWNNASNSPTATTLSADVTPPGVISDLAATMVSGNTITLTWTASGDDGLVGTASAYEVRYSTVGIINDGNWASATVYVQSWVPQASGNTETYDITGLNSGTQYWFAVRTADEIPNWASASNSPFEWTDADNLGPDILNVRINGQSIVTVARGTTVTLRADIDDQLMGNSVIGGANYTRGAGNWPGTPMTPWDGAFDSSSEMVTVSVDTSGWSEGNHRLYVYGWDSLANSNTTLTGYATVRIDATPPSSSVSSISPVWHQSGPLSITASAWDSNSDVDWVRLYYRHSSDQASWGSWYSYGTDNTEPWEWNFDFPLGEGYYEFRSIAEDDLGNAESNSGMDAQCGYDPVSPVSIADPLVKYWYDSQDITITASAVDDLSGLAGLELYYRYSTNNQTWSSWTSLTPDTMQPWSWQFDLPNGEGYYEFYTQASDLVGNTESKSQPEIMCAYDGTFPVADAGLDLDVMVGTEVTFDGSGSSDSVGVRSYEWAFTDGTAQTLTGISPTYTFENPGNFQVTLTVTDPAGYQGTSLIWVNVTAVDIPTTGTISGRVRDKNGKPIEDARIEIAGLPYFTKTNKDGHYSMGNIPQGNYDLIVSKPGFQKRTLPAVHVSAGQETANTDAILPKAAVQPEPYVGDYWWVFVLVALAVVMLIIFVLWNKKRSEDSHEQPQDGYGIHSLEHEIQRAEDSPSYPPQPAQGYTAYAPPPPPPPPEAPQEEGGNLEASESESEEKTQ
jgi:uncharacterized membrane protein